MLDLTNEKNIAKLTRLLSLMDENSLTKEDFTKAFEKVIQLVLRIQKQQQDAVSQLQKTYGALLERTKSDHSSSLSDIKSEVKKQLDNLLSKLEKKSSDIDIKLGELRDGKDADSVQIVQDVLAQIKLPAQKDVILDDAEEIRNKLETLNDTERLDMKAIKDLDKKLEELNQKASQIRGGGGKKITSVRSENLSSQCNGVLKTFIMPNDTLKVLGVWGTQMPISFNAGVDWTFTGRTLTLTNAVSAPATGQTLFALIECQFYAK